MSELENIVESLLHAAGFSPSAEELCFLTATYETFKIQVESLYEISGACYELPALRFEAKPNLTSWD
jgi:hypothetical protein